MFAKVQEIVSVLLGLRKFIVMMALILIGIIFRIKGFLDGGQMVDLLKSTAIAFMASNSVERVGETIKHYVDAKGQTVQETESVAGDTGKEEG